MKNEIRTLRFSRNYSSRTIVLRESVLARIRSPSDSKTYVLAIFCRIVPRAKVVLHLFKKPLFSGSIGNAIAFNTSNVLRFARNLVRKNRSFQECVVSMLGCRARDNISARLACLNYSLRKTRYPFSGYILATSGRHARPAEMDSKAMQPCPRCNLELYS